MGDRPYDEKLGIPPDVWAEMGPKAQEVAKLSGNQRRKLREVPGLSALCDHMMDLISQGKPFGPLSAAKARAAGITVLSETKDSSMEAGQFELPRLDESVATSPKTYDFQSATKFLLLELAFEFCARSQDGHRWGGIAAVWSQRRRQVRRGGADLSPVRTYVPPWGVHIVLEGVGRGRKDR